MSEKTEAPTGRRLSEARSEGQVARSVELNAAIALLVGVWLLSNSGGKLINGLENSLTYSFINLHVESPSMAWVRQLIYKDVMEILPSLAIIVIGLMMTGVVVTLGQTGLLWASKKIGFNFSRLNPFSGLKRLFSMGGLIEVIKAIFKLLIVGWVAYSFLRSRAGDLLVLNQIDFHSAIQFWVSMALSLAVRVGSAFFVIAVVDYAYQRRQHTKSLKMTKEEVKEDLKRTEGDPFIRGRIRNQQRRMARKRMMSRVPKSDVVITNPTHLAVAIGYDPDNMNAPTVLAKGAYKVAERIVELARSNNVPVVQNIPVARALYRTVDIDQEIPPELYTALAEVLAYVYKLRKKTLAPA